MDKFSPDFLLGAATAAHQVEGSNDNSDCWAMEQMEHTSFIAVSYTHLTKLYILFHKFR